jgi:acyl transferase domain-containing protein
LGRNGKTPGISAPDATAQQRVILEAYRRAGLETADTTYIECHGTGTQAGDPTEIEALSQVFKRKTGSPLLVGSVSMTLLASGSYFSSDCTSEFRKATY